MAVSFKALLERRVPQYLAIYLGAGWGLIEFMSFLEERFSWSPVWTNLLLFALALMIPSVLLFTWFHGRPGRDRWARAELIGIPLNFIVAIFVLTTAFGGADLSATTVRVTVRDETGNEIERRVANASYRKRLAVFHFDAPAGDTAVEWLATGASMALTTDLSQDLFIDLRLPIHFREQLREAGFANGRNVPFQLKQKIAEEAHMPYFLTGTVSRGVEGITVRVATYETASGRMIRERVSTNADVFRAIDELSIQVRQDMGLPQTRPEGVKDLPVAELLSSAPGAYRAVVEAQEAFEAGNWAAAEAGFARAIALDSTFALAHYALFQTQLMRGDAAASTVALGNTMRHLYRMPERSQFLIKADHYFMQRDMEKAFAVVNMMVELYPDDLQGHLLRAQFLMMRDERAETIAALRRVLELDPQQHELLVQIGTLQERNGQLDDALTTFQDYARRFPNDASAQLRVASVLIRLARLNDARTAIDRALLMEPHNVQAMVESAMLHRSVGELEHAYQQLENARGIARSPEDRVRVYTGLRSYHDFRGELTRAIAAMQQSNAANAEFTPPLQLIAGQMSQLGLYVRAGQQTRALAIVDEVRTSLSPPLDDFWRLGQLEVGMALRDTAMILEGIEGARAIIAGLGYRFLETNVARGTALLHEIRGDWDAALREHERILNDLDPNDTGRRRDIARALRHLGRHADALASIERALRPVPASPESNLEAARIRIAMGDGSAARAHLERALNVLAEADTGHEPAAEARRLLTEIGTH